MVESILQFLWQNSNVVLPLLASAFFLIIFHYWFIFHSPRSKKWWVYTDYLWYSLAIISLIFAGIEFSQSDIAKENSEIEMRALSLAASLDASVKQYTVMCDIRNEKQIEEIREARREEQLYQERIISPTMPGDFEKLAQRKYIMLETFSTVACANVGYINTVIGESQRSGTWPLNPTRPISLFKAGAPTVETWAQIMEHAPGPLLDLKRWSLGEHESEIKIGKTLDIIQPLEIGLIILEMDRISGNYKRIRKKNRLVAILEPITRFWPFFIGLAAALRLTKVTATIKGEKY